MLKDYIHKNLASGRWFELTMAEQLGNIGSEYYRASQAKKMDDHQKYESATERTMELCELTLDDKRWYNTPALKELCRMKNQVARSLIEKGQPDEGLQQYFDGFAYLARKDR